MPKEMFLDPKKVRAKGALKFNDIPLNAYDKTVSDERKNYSDEQLIKIFADMVALREFEGMLTKIKTQGEYEGVKHTYPGPAHLSVGQEAAAVGQAYCLTTEDYSFGSHRSHGEILAKCLSSIDKLDDKSLIEIMENFLDGECYAVVKKEYPNDTPKQLAVKFALYGTLAEIFARKTGFHKGLGGSMHAFFLPFGVYPNNAIVGGSGPVSAGGALYKKVNGKDGIVLCNLGDGSIGCGPVWEALNFSAMKQFETIWGDKGGLPLLFTFFNNGYGMGGFTSGETMAYEVVARIGSGITPTQMYAERVDGFNPLAVIDAVTRKKNDIIKEGKAPALLDIVTYRFCGHSTSDVNAYRAKEEMDAWQEVDPIVTYRAELVKAGVATDEQLGEIVESAIKRMAEICALAADVEKSPYLDMKNCAPIEKMMFSNQRVESMDTTREPEMLVPKAECAPLNKILSKKRTNTENGKPVPKIMRYNYRDAISEPLLECYYKDPTFTAYGEDLRFWGGAFAITRDFATCCPPKRLFNSPISEAAIVGSAVGYALCGGRVMAELMYADFMGRAGDEIFNQLSKWQAMSAGILKMPVVLRVSVGSKYGAQHSQDWTAMTAHVPGLKVVFPSTPYEAKGLLTTALKGTDPVVFFESQRLYDMEERFNEGGVPVGEYEIEIGAVNKVRTGSDVTILTIGAALYRAVDAAEQLEKLGVSAEVINLCSISPLDYNPLIESVNKTGKVVLVSDACERGNFMNDVARNLSEFCFDNLDAPPVVIGARNLITPPFEFDEDFFPQASWIIDAIHSRIMPIDGYALQNDEITPLQKVKLAKEGN